MQIFFEYIFGLQRDLGGLINDTFKFIRLPRFGDITKNLPIVDGINYRS